MSFSKSSDSAKTVLVIDSQGGGIGRALIESLRSSCPEVFIVAVGTNSLATSSMLKAGANVGATGENAVAYNCENCSIIAGPVGILLANAMYGEISPAMAAAVSRSSAEKVLLPVSRCRLHIAGTAALSPAQLIETAVDTISQLLK